MTYLPNCLRNFWVFLKC